MTDTSANNKRIAKNTLLLYFRMLFLMAVSLYTSRVVLNALGVEDFGIYNVVGGVVAMFSMLSGSLSSAITRFITYELGTGNRENLKKIFSSAVTIQAGLAVLFILIAEAAGVWFLNVKMNIPDARMAAANWVFQLSVLTFAVNLISVPYNASIIAHERMSAFAYISILEATGKLGIAFLIVISPIDKLVFYAVLMCMVALAVRVAYGAYCKRHFEECTYRFIFDRDLLKRMFGFAGWNFIGAASAVLRDQGGNIVINLFCGSAVNAARGIAFQVNTAVHGFVTNFMTALNPQITKSYAVQNYAHMHSLIYSSSKFTFYLLLLVSLPIILETNYILHLWLGTYPDCTGAFVRLILCITIIDSMTNPLGVAVSATGKVKVYQGVLGGVLLSILPVSYIFLKLGGNPVTVFVVHLNIVVIAFLIRLLIIRPLIRLSLYDYGKRVVLPCVSVAVASLILLVTMKKLLMLGGTAAFFAVCLSSAFCVPVIAYEFGLSVSERAFIRGKLSDILQKLK